MMRRLIAIVGAIGCVLMLAGCVIQPVHQAPSSVSAEAPDRAGDIGSESSNAYTLKALDPLYIRFSGVQEQQVLDVVIDENGEISLLHLGPVKAAGLTTSALESKIERLYVEGGIYKNVSVNVTMTAKVYYVQGEVNQPGQFELLSGTTLLQAIAGARGYTPFANRKKVTISRQGRIYTYNMKELEEDPSRDVKIEAGDIIKVWQSPW